MQKSTLMPIFNRLPVTFKHGKGMWLYDDKNNKYLDALSGMGVISLGHSHPAIIQAIKEQAERLIHTSNTYHIEEQERLSDEFTQFAGLDRAVFINSGAESCEVAFKMARVYAYENNISNPTVLVFEKGFHGRTLGTLSASGNKKLKSEFEPLLSGFICMPLNDIAAVKKIASENKNIVGIMIEPILGQGGIIVPDDNFLIELRKICTENKWLFMLDEIQSGMGRTGMNFAYQFLNLKPDILTTAKALGNGLPIAACAATKTLGDMFTEGRHGTTFGGNPLCCHVARTVMKTYREENTVENARVMGAYLMNGLQQALANKNGVVEVRGKGLMIGIELDKPCEEIYAIGLDERILVNIAAKNVIRLLPPFILNKEEADQIVDRIRRCVDKFYTN